MTHVSSHELVLDAILAALTQRHQREVSSNPHAAFDLQAKYLHERIAPTDHTGMLYSAIDPIAVAQ